jgi:homoserine/homoserine lactone efflux protein
MPFDRWLLFFATEAALSMTPGPAVLLVLSHGMSHGPWKPVWTTTGILTANALYFALSGTSLGGVLTASMPLFYAIRWLGAGYLAYLGLGAFFRRPEPVEVFTRTPAETGRPLFRQGLVLQLTNPKALVFFTALLPQFVSPGGRVGLQIVILGVTSVITEFVILAAYGALASTATRMVSNERLATWQGKVAGLLLLAAALVVASIRRE